MCAHTLAVLIDCLEIVLYLAIEFGFVNLDLPCNDLQELSFTVSLVSICQRSVWKDNEDGSRPASVLATVWRITDSNR